MNLVRGELHGSGRDRVFRKGAFEFPLDGRSPEGGSGDGQVVLGLQPEALRVVPAGTSPLTGRVTGVELRGSETVLAVESSGVTLRVLTPALGRAAEGDVVGLATGAAGVILFSGETGRRIAA